MTGADQLLTHQPLDCRRKLEQTQEVGDGGSTPTDPLRHLLLGVGEVLDQLLVGRRLFERVQILPMEVLHQRLLEGGDVIGGSHHHRDRSKAGSLGRPQTTLPGDQLVAVVELAHQDRLEDAQLLDAVREPLERLLVEGTAGLVGVGSDRLDRDLGQPRRDGIGILPGSGRDQRGQPSSQSALTRHHSPPGPAPGTPRHPGSSDRTS